jgi:CDP-glycerol glycerophosphotransferase
VLVRAHYLTAGAGLPPGEGWAVDCTAHDDINDLYLAADLLVTDYSSVLFDYADTGKPMLFYMPDLERYRGETRGFYIDLDELPGGIAFDEDTLFEAIPHSVQDFVYNGKYRRFREKFGPLDDGNAAARLADIVAGAMIR